MAKITFNPSSEDHYISVPHPKPASNYKVEWYDKMSAFYDVENVYRDSGENLTLKHCIPFRDSLFSGYIQESWQDIRFDIDGENFEYNFPFDPEIIGHREDASLPVGEELFPIEFVIKVPWMPKTPKGWSVMITQPFNRPELPFYCPTGIIDTDKLTAPAGAANLPVYLRKDAPSIVRAGTPLYQIIPFKRESWVSEVGGYSYTDQRKVLARLRQSFWGGYKKHFWQKKTYK
mgnify:FL=1